MVEIKDECAISSYDGYYSHGGSNGTAPYYFESAPLYAARMSKSEAESLILLIASIQPERIGRLSLVRWDKMR
jgi:hypothetical protein